MTLTSHQLGFFNKKKPRLQSRSETIPKVDTLIDIDINLVVFEDAEGNPKTPMTKARFDQQKKCWVQVPVSMAGLMLFFNTAPTEQTKRARIQSVIPNGRACYVNPE